MNAIRVNQNTKANQVSSWTPIVRSDSNLVGLFLDLPMKRIPLTHGRFALVDDNDYESVFRFRWHVSKGYARASMHMGMIGGKQKRAGMFLHQLIMRPPTGTEVDHRNHNGLDCRRDNMRNCTHARNSMNRSKTKVTGSQFKGVSWDKANAKWKAQIMLDGKQIHLGRFIDETEAARAYDVKAKELFSDFAYLNFQEMSQ